MDVAFGEYGVSELHGSEHTERILEYHSTTGLDAHDDETSWCASFVGWTMLKAGLASTGKANARSYLDWGALSAPQRGAVCVLWRGSPDSWMGHVGFVTELDWDGMRVQLLGGNQRDSVSTQWYPMARVLGYRWPLLET